MSEETTETVVDAEAPAETVATEVAETPTGDQTEAGTEGEKVAGAQAADQAPAEDDDLEEVEFEGKKAKIPPEFKAALLRTADYTQKTQAIADQARALETQRVQQAESVQAFRDTHVQIATQEARLAELTKARDEYRNFAGWDDLRASDPDAYTEHRARQDAVRDALRDTQEGLDVAKTELKTKETQRLEGQQATAVAEFQQTMRALQDPEKGIPGWSTEKITQVEAFAKEFGLTTEDLVGTTDPRAWKVLHEFMVTKAALKKATKVATVQKQQTTQPAQTVTGQAPPVSRLDDRAATADWMKAREEQVRKRA